LKSYFKKERIYFKFLYALTGFNPALKDCSSEYITGYANVDNVYYDNNGIYVKLQGTSGSSNLTMPRHACWDYVVNNKGGKIPPYSSCEGFSALQDGAGFDAVGAFFSNLVQMLTYNTPLQSNIGQSVKWDLSYLRIPMPNAKKGGGLRVKRLMLYDNGIETGDAHLYGQEYQYINEAGESSGVAENEPEVLHEENALVTQIPRSQQGWFNRIIYGRDKKITEGPIGEEYTTFSQCHLLYGDYQKYIFWFICCRIYCSEV
jgi:hypothetical protein